MARNRLHRRGNGNGVTISEAQRTVAAAILDAPAATAAALVDDVQSAPRDFLAQPNPEARSEPASPIVEMHDVVIHIEVICGGCTNVKVPIAVCPRYEGMALTGGAKAFDLQLDSWLTRAVELGMIGSGLGHLFFQSTFATHPVNPDESRWTLCSLAGIKEPGSFAADDLALFDVECDCGRQVDGAPRTQYAVSSAHAETSFPWVRRCMGSLLGNSRWVKERVLARSRTP